GELHRLLRVGADPSRIVYAGVGKTPDEIRAALHAGVAAFNVESVAEAAVLAAIAAAEQRTARAALRVNPEVRAGGHRYIATGTSADKFGVRIDDAVRAWEHIAALPGIELRGVHAHVGSQILDVQVHAQVVDRLVTLVRTLRSRGHAVRSVNIGGGMGIRY